MGGGGEKYKTIFIIFENKKEHETLVQLFLPIFFSRKSFFSYEPDEAA